MTSRTQLVAGAFDMIRRRGLNATSIREVAKHSGAPLGSTYHYFPGGKDQLAAEAVQHASALVEKALDATLTAGPVEGLRAFFELWRGLITSADFQAGCPVVAVAIEATDEQTEALKAAATAFETWKAQLVRSLETRNARNPERLATLVVAATEGAVVMCRAKRSTQPLDDVATELTALLETAIAART